MTSHAGSQAEPVLTRREREIFTLLAEGLKGPEIADLLVLSPDTIRTHVRNGMLSLGARTRAHGVAIALRTGEIELTGA
jgi:DNA-binding NarL/FixJ family response regulator